MAVYDLALLCDTSDSIATAFRAEFFNQIKTVQSKTILAESERAAYTYSPAMMIEFATAADIDPYKHGYLINCSAYSELVAIMCDSLNKQGFTKANETGYQVVASNSNYIYIKLILGYRTNTADVTMLSSDKVVGIVIQLVKDIQAPPKYIKIYDDSILTDDPDIESHLYWDVPESTQDGCSTNYTSDVVSNKAVNFLGLAKTTPTSKFNYFKEGYYKVSDPEAKHIFLFSARLKNGTSSKAPVTIVIGDKIQTFNVVSYDINTFSMSFTPEKVKLYGDSLPFDFNVKPINVSDLPFDITVVRPRDPMSEELPFYFEVSAKYNFYIGIKDPCAVEICGIWVCKTGVMDSLDDPIQRYTPYPNYYSAYQSVEAQVPVSETTANRLQTTTASFMNKATVQALNTLDISSIAPVTAANQMENAIKSFTSTFNTMLSGITSLTNGSIPVLNLGSLNINFGTLELGLNDVTCDFDKKLATQKMVTLMKGMDRAKSLAQTSIGNTLLTNITKNENTMLGSVKTSIVNVGESFKDITNKVDNIKSQIQSGIVSAEKAASTNLSNTIVKTISPLTTGNPLNSIIGNSSKSSVDISVSSGINKSLSDAFGKATAVINPISKITNEVGKELGSVTKGLSQLQSNILSTESKIQSVSKNINTVLAAPLPINSNNAGILPENSLTKTSSTAPLDTQVSGKDYSRYWPK